MELESQQTTLSPFSNVIIGRLDHHMAVDLVNKVVALSDNVVSVPCLKLDVRIKLIGIAEGTDDGRLMVIGNDSLLTTLSEKLTSLLFIKNAAPAWFSRRVDIRLVAANDPLTQLLRILPASILDSGIASEDAIFQLQFEIPYLSLSPNKKGVVFKGVLFSALIPRLCQEKQER